MSEFRGSKAEGQGLMAAAGGKVGLVASFGEMLIDFVPTPRPTLDGLILGPGSLPFCEEDSYHDNHIQLKYATNLSCLVVGRPKYPASLPIELCEHVPLQRYTKAVSPQQRIYLAEKSRQKPQECVWSLIDAMKVNQYHEDSLSSFHGINSIEQSTQTQGRSLHLPKVVFGNGESVMPQNGHWKIDQTVLIFHIYVYMVRAGRFHIREETNLETPKVQEGMAFLNDFLAGWLTEYL